ncbi:MAG: hypothetical protein ACRBN8_28925 [Nannocystales bacterium]
MYYGQIDGDGKLLTESAYSNNFRASGGGGTVTITLGQWTYYAPTFTLTNSPSSGSQQDYCSTYSISRPDQSSPWRVTVQTYDSNGRPTTRNISFRGDCGMRRVFTAQTLTISPKIVDFQGAKVLALHTTVAGETIYLDEGTVLIGVGTKMKLELGHTSVSDDDGNTWALTGWTYDGNITSGTQWPSSGFELATDPEGAGPATTPYLFAVKGIRTEGSGQQYISSDPVVRLSSVSPAGLSI